MKHDVPDEKSVLRALRRGVYKDCYLVYNRKSMDEAESQKNSITYQRCENLQFAKREHLPLADLTLTGLCKHGVISEKHSGFKESGDLVITKDGTAQYQIDRPKFLRLIQLLNQDQIKGVICLCWDRISRNQGDDTVLRKLRRAGADIRFAFASYDDTSSGELHMDIDGMFAQHHSRVTSEKIKLAIKTKRADGKWTHRAPIGYLNQGNVDHKPLDPERAPIIKELFELYATGDWSLSDLVRHAAKQGLTTQPMRRPRSIDEILDDDGDSSNLHPKVTRPLQANYLGSLLRNPFYIGQVIGPDGVYIPSTCHKALVDRKTFARVQELLTTKRTSIHYTEKLDHPFRGFVRCAQCRRVYTPYIKKGITYYNARCAPGCGNTFKNCNFEHISGLVRQLLEQLQFTQEEIDLLDARTDTEIGLLEEQNLKAEEQRSRQQARIREDLAYLHANQLTLLKSGVYTPEVLTQERNRLECEMGELQEQNDVSLAAMRELVDDVLKISELLNMALNLFDLATPTEKEAIGKTLVSELLIDQNTFEYSPQMGFAPLFARSCDKGAPKDWFSELYPSQIACVLESLKHVVG